MMRFIMLVRAFLWVGRGNILSLSRGGKMEHLPGRRVIDEKILANKWRKFLSRRDNFFIVPISQNPVLVPFPLPGRLIVLQGGYNISKIGSQ